LGGRVAQLNQYFPKLCPPSCGLEINFRRIKDNPQIKVFTMSEVEKVDGGPGNYTVGVKMNPRYVNENCTCCGACTEACQTEIESAFDFGMQKIKGAYLPTEMSFPARFVIDAAVKNSPADAQRVKEACKYDAVDFDMAAKSIDLQVGSILWATGWEPYDAKKIDNLGFGT
jgi:quinone-modifying oxidoreductase subunit QmoA